VRDHEPRPAGAPCALQCVLVREKGPIDARPQVKSFSMFAAGPRAPKVAPGGRPPERARVTPSPRPSAPPQSSCRGCRRCRTQASGRSGRSARPRPGARRSSPIARMGPFRQARRQVAAMFAAEEGIELAPASRADLSAALISRTREPGRPRMAGFGLMRDQLSMKEFLVVAEEPPTPPGGSRETGNASAGTAAPALPEPARETGETAPCRWRAESTPSAFFDG